VTLKYVLAAALSIAGIAGVLYLTLGGERLVPLSELADTPRPPVTADKQTTAQLLSGLHDPFPPTGKDNLVNAKRRARNALAERHGEAVALWRAGRLSIREVESIEQMLWVARAHTGEVAAAEMHEQLALLFEREQERVEILAERGFAGSDHVQRARLYVARELFLAGKAAVDPRAAAYPEMRVKYLAGRRRRYDSLVETGLAKRQHLDLEYEDLERNFPPAEHPEPEADAGASGD